jgi:large repetitive protein
MSPRTRKRRYTGRRWTTLVLERLETRVVPAITGTSTSITSSTGTPPAPTTYTDPVTFTATVAPMPPNGETETVTFDDTTLDFETNMEVTRSIGTGTLDSGMATFSTSTLSEAYHTISATYNGDANFNASTSSGLNQIVNPSTLTQLISSASAVSGATATFIAVSGQTVTFTATVSAMPPFPVTTLPTGTVDFLEGSTTLDSVSLTAGQATFSTTLSSSSLAPSSHTITAVYTPDSAAIGSGFQASTGDNLDAIVQIITPNSSKVTVTSSSGSSPSVYGAPVIFTATVTPVSPATSTPTGTVSFQESPPGSDPAPQVWFAPTMNSPGELNLFQEGVGTNLPQYWPATMPQVNVLELVENQLTHTFVQDNNLVGDLTS